MSIHTSEHAMLEDYGCPNVGDNAWPDDENDERGLRVTALSFALKLGKLKGAVAQDVATLLSDAEKIYDWTKSSPAA